MPTLTFWLVFKRLGITYRKVILENQAAFMVGNWQDEKDAKQKQQHQYQQQHDDNDKQQQRDDEVFPDRRDTSTSVSNKIYTTYINNNHGENSNSKNTNRARLLIKLYKLYSREIQYWI